MPELPDVEGFRTVFESCATGRTVRHVEVRDTGVLHGVSVRGLCDALEGRRFTGSQRHGKWLLARTGGPTLLLHFGMTVRLLCCRPDDPFIRTTGSCSPSPGATGSATATSASSRACGWPTTRRTSPGCSAARVPTR